MAGRQSENENIITLKQTEITDNKKVLEDFKTNNTHLQKENEKNMQDLNKK